MLSWCNVREKSDMKKLRENQKKTRRGGQEARKNAGGARVHPNIISLARIGSLSFVKSVPAGGGGKIDPTPKKKKKGRKRTLILFSLLEGA